MSREEREALLDFLAFIMRYVSRHGTPAEQAAVLEHWQAVNEQLRD
jgi:hypothetical protein